MPTPNLKVVLKRGALLAAANWQVTLIQFVGESTFKILLAVPIVGGALLVALALGRDLGELLRGDLRDTLSVVAAALLAQPIALSAFLVALSLVLFGGASLMFLVKGGTVTVLAEADRVTGAIERPPLRLATFWHASQFSTDRFTLGCARLFRRYLRLGLLLIAVYAVSVVLYLTIIFAGYRLMRGGILLIGWTLVAGMSSTLLVVWITVVNLVYLVIQIVIAVDDRGVRTAARQVSRFLRTAPKPVFGVFAIVLLLVVVATIVSVLATAGLSLIAFVPLVGLIVLPLQLAAWLFRGLVFEYIGMTALTAYLRLYRNFTTDEPTAGGSGL